MVKKILFVVDGSAPAHETAAKVHDFLPKATDVLVLEVVPQLPYAWNTWPAFPDPGEDLAKASAYVAKFAGELEALGWTVSTKVHWSPLSAAEIDQEVLGLVSTLQPGLICLALENGRVRANIVREAVVPVLVTRTSAAKAKTPGHRVKRREAPEPALACHALLLNPAGALVFRAAGIL